ncbi:uncharacterized protein APUU_10703A [Aspergillus puulaauensis]|uniref:Uncharacterized protein n=1 Tax=Aspergillus puulaauensis TaxID=1220207 RepID=A0A7R8AHS0_9EURO|nr:uncharacterized protein APUU_10703A [Aspergillus puulaauensis]BCS17875.1 hypothetical protein APUU_10703A [Aspergillus puulaauensis]
MGRQEWTRRGSASIQICRLLRLRSTSLGEAHSPLAKILWVGWAAGRGLASHSHPSPRHSCRVITSHHLMASFLEADEDNVASHNHEICSCTKKGRSLLLLCIYHGQNKIESSQVSGDSTGFHKARTAFTNLGRYEMISDELCRASRFEFLFVVEGVKDAKRFLVSPDPK